MAPATVTPAPAAPAPSRHGTAIPAPLPGSIFSLKVSVGDTVSEGDVVLIMESMKMESEVKSPLSGTVQSIAVKEGDNVQTGDPLATIG